MQVADGYEIDGAIKIENKTQVRNRITNLIWILF